MRWALGILLALLPGCVEMDGPTPESDLCTYIAECVPVQTSGVDWGDVAECEAALVDYDACLKAWAAVECMPANPTVDDVMARTPAVRAAVNACLGVP